MTPSERETHLNMVGDNHDEWLCFTDDPFMIRRLAKLGVKPTATVGSGYEYRLPADMVLLRRGKRCTSEATRQRSVANLKNVGGTVGIEA